MTVAIIINGQPIMARSAHRIKGKNDEVCEYKVDDGTVIKHSPGDGVVLLAKKMLDTIVEGNDNVREKWLELLRKGEK